MAEKEFTASNGGKVIPAGVSGFRVFDGTNDGGHPNELLVSARGMSALREFFQQERDTELGRWRWPEDPEYVVYPVIVPAHEMAFGPDLSVMVLHEPTGVLTGYCREEDEGGELFREYPAAARAYFAAHPEPKPWRDAMPGEVWVLTYDGEEGVYMHSNGAWYGQAFVLEHPIRDINVTAGRRIWPEPTDATP